MNSEEIYRNRRKQANSLADCEVQKALLQISARGQGRIASTPDSTSNSEGDRFCRLTRKRLVRRRGLFAVNEPATTNRRADANGSRSLQSRNHTHYVAGSVVQTDVHHPTDNTLLWDVVRVVTRLVGHLRKAVQQRIKGFRNRTRAARRRMQEIQRLTPKQRHERQTEKYRELIGVTEEVVNSAQKVVEQTRKARGKDLLAEMAIPELRKEIDHYCELGDRVIDQARRRVLHGEQVLNAEKIYSIFEPHTDLIKRGKVQTPLEFGHKVFLAESAQGLITQYQVLEGNPGDDQQVEPSLKRHKETFGHAPELYGSDRGFFSEMNVKSCKRNGVKVVCIPQRGGKKAPARATYEKSPDFKKGQRFRAGIEGRISVLFRGRGMKRCLAEGRERFALWVGAAVLANNLMRIAALLTKRSSRKRRKRRAA